MWRRPAESSLLRATVGRPLAMLAIPAAVSFGGGCSRCGDLQKYDPGTTFRVTVPHAFSGCHVTFNAGATYALVAGPVTQLPRGEGELCDANGAKDPPVFTTSEYVPQRCEADSRDSMGLFCVAELSSCPGAGTTQLDFAYTKLPESPGDRVDSVLDIDNSTNPDCPAAVCNANVPVTITW